MANEVCTGDWMHFFHCARRLQPANYLQKTASNYMKENKVTSSWHQRAVMDYIVAKLKIYLIYIVGWVTSSRIQPARVFLGRSCQNKLMRSNNFDVNIPVTMCTEVEARANNCENKASLWTNYKNSFAWLTSMKKLIFGYNKFFGSGHFLIHDI